MKPYQKIPPGYLAGRLISRDTVLLPNNNQVTVGNIAEEFQVGDIISFNPEQTKAILLAPALMPPQIIDPSHIALKWNPFVASVRNFFLGHDFFEVKTPTLVQSSGAETHLDPFTTKFKDTTYYLPTSPEFHLKMLVSRGLNKIFEIRSCYRQDELSSTHNHEFTMLEWYRGYAGIEEIVNDVKSLLKAVANQPTTEVVTIAELFKRYLNFDLRPNSSIEDLRHLYPQHHSTDTWSDIFFRIFLEKIEPHIGKTDPAIVTNFPPKLSALARINNDGWADRFEVYWRGLELGNAYDELNDPIECENRLKDWNAEKVNLGKSPIPYSEELLNALKMGFPPSGGIAMGLDRLFMAIHNLPQIGSINFFSPNT